MDSKLNEKKLSFVLYQEEKTPQYFEIKKNFLKFLFIAFPITLILLLFFIVIGTLYLRKIKNLATDTVATNIEMPQTFQNKEKEYLKRIQALEEKLTKPAEGLGSLGIFKQVKGQIDLTKKPLLSVENITTASVGNKLQLQFALNNITDTNKKISGHLFVVLKNNNALRVFPENSFLENDFQASFNKGEKFSFNRLRPFVITFSDGKIYQNLNFKIIVFSQSGDLLFDKNYSIGKN